MRQSMCLCSIGHQPTHSSSPSPLNPRPLCAIHCTTARPTGCIATCACLQVSNSHVSRCNSSSSRPTLPAAATNTLSATSCVKPSARRCATRRDSPWAPHGAPTSTPRSPCPVSGSNSTLSARTGCSLSPRRGLYPLSRASQPSDSRSSGSLRRAVFLSPPLIHPSSSAP